MKEWKHLINKSMQLDEYESWSEQFYDLDYQLNCNYSFTQMMNRHSNRKNALIISEYFKSKKILIAGCSCGQLIDTLLRDHNIDAYGFDLFKPPDKHVYPDARDRFRVGSMHNIPAEPGEFDVLVSWDVLEHIPHNILVNEVKSEVRRLNFESMLHVIGCSDVEGVHCDGHITQRDTNWWRELFKPNYHVSSKHLKLVPGEVYYELS